MLFIEYDVDTDGVIALVALINAVEADGQDPNGEAWLSWRSRGFDDEGMGCAAVSHVDLASMESADDPDELRSIVERIVLADRAEKEQERT